MRYSLRNYPPKDGASSQPSSGKACSISTSAALRPNQMKPKILTEAQCKALRHQVALRDNYHCVLCGNPATSVHHIIYRSFTKSGSATIWQLKNMVSLCTQCHAKCHQHPLEMRRLLLKRMVELYQYRYDDEPFAYYLIEEE